MSLTLTPLRSRSIPDPFEEFERDMGRLFGLTRRAAANVSGNANGNGNGTESGEWFNPTLNLAETEEAFEVSVDLPGMNDDDIDIEVKGNELWITGERRVESVTGSPAITETTAVEPDDAQTGTPGETAPTELVESAPVTASRTWHCVESSYGMFRRTIRLPEGVDSANVEANYTNGVLHITVPKAEIVKPHRVEIKH